MEPQKVKNVYILLLVLSNTFKRKITNYLFGKQGFMEYRGQKSKYRMIKMDVPQGGVLSSLLFNIYLVN